MKGAALQRKRVRRSEVARSAINSRERQCASATGEQQLETDHRENPFHRIHLEYEGMTPEGRPKIPKLKINPDTLKTIEKNNTSH